MCTVWPATRYRWSSPGKFGKICWRSSDPKCTGLLTAFQCIDFEVSPQWRRAVSLWTFGHTVPALSRPCACETVRNIWGPCVGLFVQDSWNIFYNILHACCMQFEFGLPNLVGFPSFLVPPTFPLSCQTFQQFSHVRPGIRMVDSVDGTMFYHICQVHALWVLKQQLLLKLTAIGL